MRPGTARPGWWRSSGWRRRPSHAVVGVAAVVCLVLGLGLLLWPAGERATTAAEPATPTIDLVDRLAPLDPDRAKLTTRPVIDREPTVAAAPAASPPEPLPVADPEPAPVAGVGAAAVAGEVLMVGLPAGWSPGNPSPLDQFAPGAVLLLGSNIQGGVAGIRSLAQQIRDYVGRQHPGARPPLLAVDHEGGRVNRLRRVDGVFSFQSARSMVQGLRPRAAGQRGVEVGQRMAAELRALGFDWNLAPVCDVVTVTGNQVIGDRAFGTEPVLVSAAAGGFIVGSRAGGILTCAKHWPGLGTVQTDPHTTVTRTAMSAEEWEAAHLPPFQAAVQNRVDAIMVSHAIYPFLGDRPASLTPAAYQLLRQRLGFDGVVVADDLSMAGVASLYPGRFGDLAVATLAAGADLLITGQQPAATLAAHQAVTAAVASGHLDLTAAQARLSRLRGGR